MTTQLAAAPLQVRNPADHAVLAELAVDDAAAVAAAASELRRAQTEWHGAGAKARASWLRRWRRGPRGCATSGRYHRRVMSSASSRDAVSVVIGE